MKFLAQISAAFAAPARRVVDWQIKASVAIEQVCDFLVRKAGDDPAIPQFAGKDEPDGLTCYQKQWRPSRPLR